MKIYRLEKKYDIVDYCDGKFLEEKVINEYFINKEEAEKEGKKFKNNFVKSLTEDNPNYYIYEEEMK